MGVWACGRVGVWVCVCVYVHTCRVVLSKALVVWGVLGELLSFWGFVSGQSVYISFSLQFSLIYSFEPITLIHIDIHIDDVFFQWVCPK